MPDITTIRNRTQKGQIYCRNARAKFEKRLSLVKETTTYSQAIMTFYDVTEDIIQSEALKICQDKVEATIRQLCWQICMEAINRDLINYVRFGEKGVVGQSVYDALKETSEPRDQETPETS